MYKTGKTKTKELTLEILTPIHIGSGEKLNHGFDYIEKNGKPFVVDKSAIYDLIADIGKHDDERLLFKKDFKIQDLIDITEPEGSKCGYLLNPISTFKPKQQINECIKNAYLKPYIPGSSLKGAIRTAIIGSIFYGNEKNYKKLFLINNTNKSIADDKLMDKLIGSEPKKDIFRAFKVSDISFPNNPEPVLAGIKVENIYKGIVQDLYVEAINKGQYGRFSMSWDTFLLNNLKKWNDTNEFNNVFFSSYKELCKLINTYSMNYLKKEIDFYQRAKLREITTNLENLYNKIKQDNNENVSKAYIQMSWGAGWRNKTGNWLYSYLEDIRRKYRLGKGEGAFPRTRRLIYNNQQAETPGWVCISTEPVKIKPQKKSCPWLDETIDQLCQQHHSKPDLILRGKVLANEWNKISEKETKDQVLKEIIERWKEKGWMEAKAKGSFKKAQDIYRLL